VEEEHPHCNIHFNGKKTWESKLHILGIILALDNLIDNRLTNKNIVDFYIPEL
jgi:hypothetical protein